MQVIFNIPDETLVDYARSLKVIQGEEETIGQAKARLRRAMWLTLYKPYRHMIKLEARDNAQASEAVVQELGETE